jgi:preprotein translocase subunit YajC
MDEKTVTVEVEGGTKMKFEKGFISMDLTKIANQAKNKEVTTK